MQEEERGHAVYHGVMEITKEFHARTHTHTHRNNTATIIDRTYAGRRKIEPGGSFCEIRRDRR